MSVCECACVVGGGGGAGGRKEGGNTELKTKTQHVNVGKKL